MELDAHSSEPAIILRYEASDASSTGKRWQQKIIHLKDLSEAADTSTIARLVLDSCSIIPANRLAELEQIVFYLQKRAYTPKTGLENMVDSSSRSNASTNIGEIARVEKLDDYLEMLYDEAEKVRGVAMLLQLALNPDNLDAILENEVLMGALARVFREDSKRNFELATNIANIFFLASQFAQYHPVLSHWKVGALTMQLVEHELKRWDLWKEQAKSMDDANQRKWDFAMRKQDQLVNMGFKTLVNLSDDVRVESKMVRRSLVPLLAKCLRHSTSPQLLLSSVQFMWKLSVFAENQRPIADSEGALEKLVALVPNADSEMVEALLSLLFNLSFDQGNRKRMVNAGLLNYVAPFIEANKMALALLYQLSIVDDAKAMFAFTDCIPQLLKLLFKSTDSSLVKALLVNITLEKRNAQLLCSSDGQGLDALMSFALANADLVALKIARNVSAHDGTTQEMFSKWLPQLVENALAKTSLNGKLSQDHYFGVECVGICANLSLPIWPNLDESHRIIDFLRKCFQKVQKLEQNEAKNGAGITDEVILQLVIWCGTLAARPEMAKRVADLIPQLIAALNQRQEDDEIVLQVVYVFQCLLSHPELAKRLCGEDSQIVEYLINLMHDKNPRLRTICDQALQFISESSRFWAQRINDQRFRWHNAQWLEMVALGAVDPLELLDPAELEQQFQNNIYFEDAEQLLEDENDVN